MCKGLSKNSIDLIWVLEKGYWMDMEVKLAQNGQKWSFWVYFGGYWLVNGEWCGLELVLMWRFKFPPLNSALAWSC